MFKLKSYPEDEETILKLMEDKKFLVKNPASYAAVFSESQKGVLKIVQTMSLQQGYEEFILRDILSWGSEKVFKFLIEIARDPAMHMVVLKVLIAKSWGHEIPFLKDDLNSQDPYTRLLALKVLLHNPLENSHTYYEKAAKDLSDQIRFITRNSIYHSYF